MRLLARRLIGIAAMVVLVAACGSSDETVSGRATTPDAAGSARVPAGFGTRPTAANDDWLVGVVKEPYLSTTPSTVAAVDLRTNQTKTFSGPLDGESPIAIEGLLGDGDSFIGVGNRCVPPDGGEGCQGPHILVRLDPASGTWQTDEIPLDPDVVFDAVHLVGRDLVLIETGNQVLRISRRNSTGRWSLVSTLPTTDRPSSCVTGEELWLFARDSGDSNSTAANDAKYSLTRVDLADGEPTKVDLPELAGYFGGVTTSFGCDATGPIVSSTRPGTVPPANADPTEMRHTLTGAVVWQRSGNSWKHIEVKGFEGATVIDSIVSGDRPLILGAELEQQRDNRPIAVLLGDEGDTEIPRNGTDTYLWRGGTGDLIRIYDQDSERRVQIIETNP